MTDLLGWRDQLEDFGADAFYVAEAALEQGWNDPAVQALLRGEPAETDEDEDDYAAQDLTDIRLRVLEHQGRQEAYLNLAAAQGREALVLGMLVKQGRSDEVMASYQTILETPADALHLAQTLRSTGEADKALEVALFGLEPMPPPSPSHEFMHLLEQGGASRFALASWTAELAEGLGRQNAALSAYTVTFKERPSLDAYRRLEALAGAGWAKLKKELLAALESRAYRFFTEARVGIFLHEGLVEAAMRAVQDENSHYGDLIRRVMEAALDKHADWVLENARRRAEGIMDEGKSQHYSAAAQWLEQTRATYGRADRFEDWELYLNKLAAKHKRKYRLMEQLRRLKR